jgi:hypothetical protein
MIGSRLRRPVNNYSEYTVFTAVLYLEPGAAEFIAIQNVERCGARDDRRDDDIH